VKERRARALLAGLALCALAGCRASAPESEPEPLAARRSDIIAALYQQLDFVLHRYASIADEPGAAAEEERAELAERARAIRLTILRTDPNADIAALVERLDRLGPTPN